MYQELPLEKCSDEDEAFYKDFWKTRGFTELNGIYFFCIDTNQAIIGGDEIYISNYVGLRIDVQHCPEYRPKEECDMAMMSRAWQNIEHAAIAIDYL